MVSETLKLTCREAHDDDAETSSSVFLSGDVFVVFRERERRERGELTSDSRDLIIFFTLSRKEGSLGGDNGAKKRRRDVRVDDSPPPFFVSTSLGSSLLLSLFFYSLRRLYAT